MGKLLITAFVAIAIIASLSQNYHATDLTTFLKSALFETVIFLIILLLAWRLVHSILSFHLIRAILTAMTIIVIVFFYMSTQVFVICPDELNVPHFRTNTVTGSCDFGYYETCDLKDAWYFKNGCDISKEDKMAVVVKSGIFAKVDSYCKMVCGEGTNSSCISGAFSSKDVSCRDIVDWLKQK